MDRLPAASFNARVFAPPLAGLVLIVVHVSMHVMTNVYDEASTVGLRVAAASHCLLSLIVLLALTASLYGFYVSTKFASRHVGYSAATVLFLGPTFVLFVYAVLLIVPQALYLADSHVIVSNAPQYSNWSACLRLLTPAMNSQSANSTDPNMDTSCVTRGDAWILIVEFTLDLCQVYVQTSFLIHAQQLVPVLNGVLTQKQYQAFKGCLLLLMVFNFYWWIRVSFLADSRSPYGVCLFRTYYRPDSWTLVVSVTVPIIAFYRFQSFVTFLMWSLKF